MRRWLTHCLDSSFTVFVACGLTLALGLIFVFVWAPHPWGWQGIDQYHELARGLARGEPFATTDVPWAYAYYIAGAYALFGEHNWIPVTLQAVINAVLPWLLFLLVRPLADLRIAVLSSILTGLLSFNTVYASTQSTDSICTVLFIAALVAFANAIRSTRWIWFAVAGALLGAAAQFRPNLILFPPLAAALYVAWPPRKARKLAQAATLLLVVTLALTPWIVRNYRLTGLFLPTSTHGGVQLWYGTLQVGPYLENRAANPRAAFGPASFPYTSIAEQPIIVQAFGLSCRSWDAAAVTLVVWSDRDTTRHRLAPRSRRDTAFVFDLPPQPAPTVLYYYLEARWPGDDTVYSTPRPGADDPWIYIVSADHLGDLDAHDDLLDVFDILRLVRAAAWNEPVLDPRTDFDRNGRIDARDLARAMAALATPGFPQPTGAGAEVEADPLRAILRLPDGSTMTVPRQWDSRVTDVIVSGGTAQKLLSTRRTWTSLLNGPARQPSDCRGFEDVRLNAVFYRAEVDAMRRYTALALDNIRHDPLRFLAASGYRMLRLFVVRGSADPDAVQQFQSSGIVYAIATTATAVYLLLFLAGVWVATRERLPLLVLLVPIVYVPLTICFVLTNMRYTITMQPLVFAFIATALVRALAGRPTLRTDASRPSASAPWETRRND